MTLTINYVKIYDWFAILRKVWPIFLPKHTLVTFYWLISYISPHILDTCILALGHVWTAGKLDVCMTDFTANFDL